MRLLLATSSRDFNRVVRSALERFQYEIVEADNGVDAFQQALAQKFDLLLLDYPLARMNAAEVLQRFLAMKGLYFPPVLCFIANENQRRSLEALRYPKFDTLAKPVATRILIGRIQHILHEENRIVCLGGGTGLFTLLTGLKTLPGLRLTSVVSMSDDGGSTGRLKHMFGILPPGDIRRSLVALSTAPDLVNELMQYRFVRGGELEGHNLGNLLLTALTEMRGSMSRAVRALSEILNIQGEVIPVTENANTLYAELESGETLHGEAAIDIFESGDPSVRIRRLWQEPEASAHPDALDALENARYILLGPGDLFTSVISNLIVRGIAEAVVRSRAKKIYVCNIMTEPGETNQFQVSDHVREITKYLGRDCLDYVLCSSTQFSEAALKNYALKKQQPVVEKNTSDLDKATAARIIWEDVASEDELVRHDALKLASAVKKIVDADKRNAASAAPRDGGGV